MVDSRAQAQLTANLYPQRIQRKELDDSAGKVLRMPGIYSFESSKDVATDRNKHIYEMPGSRLKGDRAFDSAYITHNLS